MTTWQKKYDSQQKLFLPLFLPLAKAIGLAPFLNKRQILSLQEALDPFLRERNEKIIFYIRIYTSLVNAAQFFETGKRQKARNTIAIVLARTSSTSFGEEKRHVSKLNALSSDILSITNLNEKPTGHHFRTKIQLAQNICILRLLKI